VKRLSGVAGLLFLAAATVLLAGWRTDHHQQRAAPRWEYAVLAVHDTAHLNSMGREGWELVAVTTAIFGGNTYPNRPGDLFFKRPLP
jgi:hypothetical protein